MARYLGRAASDRRTDAILSILAAAERRACAVRGVHEACSLLAADDECCLHLMFSTALDVGQGNLLDPCHRLKAVGNCIVRVK